MLCCEPRRQSKCLSTLRDLAIVMVEQAWIGELLERLVKLVASHPLSVCLSVWRKLKLTKICYILPAHKVRPPTAEAPSHSLLLNSLPLSHSSCLSLSYFSLIFSISFSAALFVLFYCCCCCCWSLLQFICMLKYVCSSLIFSIFSDFFPIFFWFCFLSIFFVFNLSEFGTTNEFFALRFRWWYRTWDAVRDVFDWQWNNYLCTFAVCFSLSLSLN